MPKAKAGPKRFIVSARVTYEFDEDTPGSADGMRQDFIAFVQRTLRMHHRANMVKVEFESLEPVVDKQE